MLKLMKKNNIEATINSYGAYVESLKFNDKEILFSLKKIVENSDEKDRGGSHICFPFFGINSNYSLPRHGFGRTLEWTLVDSTESKLTYKLENSILGFENLIATLTYSIQNNTFITDLNVENVGENDLEISPGFHPYFRISNIKNVKINDMNINYSNKELIDSVFSDNIFKLETEEYSVKIKNSNLDKFVLWTSFSDEFLCVEPTYNHLEKPYKLKPKESMNFSFNLEIYVF